MVAKLESVLERLDREPLQDGEGRITGRRFAASLWPLAVRSSTVRFVPLAIDRAYRGDFDLIRKMAALFADGSAFGGYSPAMGIAIGCHETGRTRDWYRRARSLYPSLVSAAPDDSWDRLCAAYRPDLADPSFFAPVASDIPTLIYAGGLDPATPVVDAYQSLRFLSRATLVEIPEAAHAPLGIDKCTRGIGKAFLENPEGEPGLNCLQERPALIFATDGLDALLDPESGS